MSLTKRMMEAGQLSESKVREEPLLLVGQRFSYHAANIKSSHGRWEVVKNDNAPTYWCKRVLKDGTLSKSESMNNFRYFDESQIYRHGTLE